MGWPEIMIWAGVVLGVWLAIAIKSYSNLNNRIPPQDDAFAAGYTGATIIVVPVVLVLLGVRLMVWG